MAILLSGILWFVIVGIGLFFLKIRCNKDVWSGILISFAATILSGWWFISPWVKM